MGTSSKAAIHFVGEPCSRVVYITEGALKADIAHALTGRTFAALIGANNTSGFMVIAPSFLNYPQSLSAFGQ